MVVPTHMIVLGVVLVAVGFGVGSAYGPVSRVRVERFARRQRLTVTPGNGNQVIAYLATTRRWRAAGLVGGLAVSTAWSLRHDAVTANFLTLFAGWFVGALVAEVRVAHLARGTRRVASLQPRRPEAYVSHFAWYLLPVTVGLSAVATLLAAVVAVRDGRPSWWSLAGFGAALAVAAMVRVTQFRVLRRPQPLAASATNGVRRDVIEADDAIRSRSLHVLSGGGAALVLYCVTSQLRALGLAGDDPLQGTVAVLGLISVLGIPFLGWHVATLAWRVKRPAGMT